MPPTLLENTLIVLDKRPTELPTGKRIPPEYMIMNAPRPLYASDDLHWTGDFVHGVFWVAVDPNDPLLIEMNLNLDAYRLHFIDYAAVAEDTKAYFISQSFTVSDWAEYAEEREWIWQSYRTRHPLGTALPDQP
jgi:hypothetical protein